MAILTISDNGTTSGTFVEVPKIIEYKVTYNKLWASDAGRTVDGEQKGTLIGIFPKIEVTVGKLTQSESTTLQALLLQDRTYVRYYNDTTNSYKQGLFYFGDVASIIKHGETQRRDSTSFSIISCSKMANHTNVS